MTTLSEYYGMLERFDWFYEYSDDHRIWNSGRSAHAILEKLAKTGPEYSKLYNEFRAHHFSGEQWKTEKAPYPTKPN